MISKILIALFVCFVVANIQAYPTVSEEIDDVDEANYPTVRDEINGDVADEILQKEFYDELLQYISDQLENPVSDDDNWKLDSSWPEENVTLGQVAGVAVDADKNVYVVHRGNKVWDLWSFDENNKYMDRTKGPIQQTPLLKMDFNTGEVLEKWGENIFYLPHGLTVDSQGNTWVTDTALHQVMKFGPDHKLSLALGEPFVPGSDSEHFCKPTDVAVSSKGDIFVADGYCNARIMKFSPDGKLVSQWGQFSESKDDPLPGTFAIPHSIVLLEQRDEICVADRENKRIQCFVAGLNDSSQTGQYLRQLKSDDLGRPYAISYDQQADLMYVVNGETDKVTKVQGLTLHPDTGAILEKWSPFGEGFSNPHDVAVCPDGRHLFISELDPHAVWKMELIDDGGASEED